MRRRVTPAPAPAATAPAPAPSDAAAAKAASTAAAAAAPATSPAAKRPKKELRRDPSDYIRVEVTDSSSSSSDEDDDDAEEADIMPAGAAASASASGGASMRHQYKAGSMRRSPRRASRSGSIVEIVRKASVHLMRAHQYTARDLPAVLLRYLLLFLDHVDVLGRADRVNRHWHATCLAVRQLPLCQPPLLCSCAHSLTPHSRQPHGTPPTLQERLLPLTHNFRPSFGTIHRADSSSLTVLACINLCFVCMLA